MIESTPGNGRFLYGAVNHFTPQDTMDFFEGLGVPLKTERGNRVFPVSDNAHDIADALWKKLKKVPRGNSAGQCERGADRKRQRHRRAHGKRCV